MVKLNKIYTRTGDDGTTGLATGQRVRKYDIRVQAYGATDEANSAIGIARLHIGQHSKLATALERIQNDMFDLGADLATPEPDPQQDKPLEWEPLRIVESQVKWLEAEIDRMNTDIPPLDSFVLPAGTPLATYLHMARTITRRAETLIAKLNDTEGEIVSPPALAYINRLSDFLFVAARYANGNGKQDVKWIPGANR
ncbi:cob(I)yrinic acid a,c-diamide adenosyltransferase [Hirschia baltica]|uniref:Corrinoid adenosyltransferase n=1 Tax=Hirschia baltica (strain ATCC 49814 / DSM 5838 / IFAM 1418) TaxID=582402 RepID=C6XLP2_HIRBI|nr:cob(I)yrinic acid a,c-diamide adenosyltransferase [Hirschia baltica]ACT57948.1 ATP/cobalamin adenosyltransferase [Hirschia baltica ATCC 49814]